jgi:hypothetical protein
VEWLDFEHDRGAGCRPQQRLCDRSVARRRWLTSLSADDSSESSEWMPVIPHRTQGDKGATEEEDGDDGDDDDDDDATLLMSQTCQHLSSLTGPVSDARIPVSPSPPPPPSPGPNSILNSPLSSTDRMRFEHSLIDQSKTALINGDYKGG